MMNEELTGLSDKVKLVKDYLDKNFARAKASMMGDNGRPESKEVVAWLDADKQIMKTLDDVQLFYVIQDQFKGIIADKDERDKFLKQVIKDWYAKKISNVDTLSAY